MAERSSADVIKLDPIQREVLLGEIVKILAAPLPQEVSTPYEHLRRSVDDSVEIPPELTQHLGMMIESAIASGRAKRFGAGVQQSMVALFQRLPNGKAIGDSIDAVNAALEKVKGQSIEQISTVLRAPGSYALTLRTDQLQMVLIFDRTGLSIESLEVNLG